MRNKLFRRWAAWLLCALLLAALSPVGLAAEDDGEEPEYRLTVSIRTAEDLLILSRSCSLDAWSRDVLVELENDISLSGYDFSPIPSFSGTFEGQGHTISGLSVTGNYSPAGLFARIQEEGVIRSLIVEGNVLPQGEGVSVGGIAGLNTGRIENCRFTGSVSAAEQVGGIAGRNTMSGTISSCRVLGGVFGRSMTGGIAGNNLGAVSGCVNESYVNIVSSDPQLKLGELEINGLSDVLELASADTLNLTSDTGGIAGYNTGTLDSCRNENTVGYQHVGYNVGGIAGRSCGFITGCVNIGDIFGRKEVGGIAGQAEPYVEVSITEDLLATLSGQMGGLNHLINNAIRHTDETMGDLADRFVSMAGILKPVQDALNRLDVTDPDSLKAVMDQISGALGSLQGQIGSISGQMGQVSDTLSEDFRSINNQLGAISGTTIDAMSAISGASLSDRITDASGTDIESVTSGKLFGCENRGGVTGDINVGGIAGALGVESALDPEDDFHSGVSSTVREEYLLKAVLQQCVNRGSILAKKDSCGSVCGRIDLGMIYQCQGLGQAESESGSYVGGIAGLCYSTVRRCYAKCFLAGESYVGGIVGSGDTDSLTGISSQVVDCVSMVEILRCRQFAGAIAGNDTGSFSGNRFVSDTLSGINTLSYERLAEPVDYADLIEEEDLPDVFRQFTLSFLADGQPIKELSFTYGTSFSPTVIPAVPEKDGCYGLWSRTELNDLRFDTRVTADYRPLITALPSRELKDDKPVMLVEGQFRSGDELQLLFEDPAEVSMEPFSQGMWDSLRGQLRDLLRGMRPDPYIPNGIAQVWQLTIPGDGLDTHTVRLCASEELFGSPRVYLAGEKGWERIENDTVGHYLVFDVQKNSVRGVVISTIKTSWLLLGGVAAAVIVLLLVFILVRLVRRWKRRRMARPPKVRQPMTAEKKRLLRRRIPLAAAAALVLAGGVFFAVRSDRLQSRVALFTTLRELSAREELDMAATVELEDHVNEFSLCRTRLDKASVTRLDWQGIPVYGCEGIYYLENGKDFVLSDGGSDPGELFTALKKLFRTADVKREIDGETTFYALTPRNGQADELLALCFPGETELPEIGDMTLTLRKKGDDISLLLDGTLQRRGEEEPLRAELRVLPSAGGHTVPEAVAAAIRSGSGVPRRVLTGDVLRLLSAKRHMEELPRVAADIRCQVNCGTLLLDEQLQYARCLVNGTAIHSLQTDPSVVYFTADAVAAADGRILTAVPDSLSRMPKLWDGVKSLLENGDFRCETANGQSVYTLSLSGDDMRSLALAMAPRIAELNVTFRSGELRAVVADDMFTELTLSFAGSVRIVLADIDASFHAQLLPRSVPYVYIPQAVKETLAGEGGENHAQ